MGENASNLPPAPVSPGDVVSGKYVVEHTIAEGGMGIVYAAKHLHLEQAVALKVMRSELRGRISTSRFTLEARATARLKSAHVARVFDVGVLDNGTPYMVMELLEGIDLERLMTERGRIAPAIAAELMTQACEAIKEAHEAGIIHRDLKPANLFLTKTSQGIPFLKVLDFGISKATVEGSSLSATAAEAVIGSPPYMSPEQLKSSRNADERSDIWSIGVILYELVTGKLPFEGEGVGDLALKVHHEVPIWPRAIDPSIPEEYETIVRACMQRDASERFTSVSELEAALRAFVSSCPDETVPLSIRTTQPRVVIVDEPSVPKPPPSASRSATTVVPSMTLSDSNRPPREGTRRVWITGAVLAGAAITAFALVAIHRESPPAASAGAASVPLNATAMATAPGVTRPPSAGPAADAPAVLDAPSPIATAASSNGPRHAKFTATTIRFAASASSAPTNAAPSLTASPPPVQPEAPTSPARGVRDRGF